MKQPTILYNLTDIQKKYARDFSHRFYVVPPGRRGRKTLIGQTCKIYYPAMKVPETTYFLAAPTRTQAKRIFWNRLKNDMRYFMKSKSDTELIVTLNNGSMIQVDGLDKPERLEGSPWDGGLITETGNTKPAFWKEHIRPCFSDTARIVKVNDTKNGIDSIQLGFCLLDGVPEGRNHYYDLALKACNGMIPKTEAGKGQFKENGIWAYYHWFSGDVLPQAEIDEAREDLDERTFQQEYEGEFISFAGALYYNFSRENINDNIAKYDPNEPIYLSCDFNKSPLVWLVAQRRGDVCLVIDEIKISYNAKTQHAAEMFCERYKNRNNNTVYLTGDASGKIETTHDYSTDYMIIDSILKEKRFNVVFEVPSFNPNINNRVNLVCSLLKTLSGKIRCFINSKCTALILDLEKNIGDSKGGKDKGDPERTHASDAFDYLITCMFGNSMTGYSVGQVKMN